MDCPLRTASLQGRGGARTRDSDLDSVWANSHMRLWASVPFLICKCQKIAMRKIVFHLNDSCEGRMFQPFNLSSVVCLSYEKFQYCKILPLVDLFLPHSCHSCKWHLGQAWENKVHFPCYYQGAWWVLNWQNHINVRGIFPGWIMYMYAFVRVCLCCWKKLPAPWPLSMVLKLKTDWFVLPGQTNRLGLISDWTSLETLGRELNSEERQAECLTLTIF